MFGNLIESGSHTRDIKRRSSFFLGTLAFYAVLLSAAGVASIYAYDAHLKEEQDWTLVAMMRFAPAAAAAAEPERREPPKADDANANRKNVATRIEISVNAPLVPSRKVADEKTPEVAPGKPVIIAPTNFDPVGTGVAIGTGGTGDGHALNPGTSNVSVPVDNVEPPPAPKQPPPVEKPRPKVLALSNVISSKIIEKPVPVYPAIARATRTQGPVTVQILVDEEGRVISAKATSGHQLLQVEAVRAAYRARFTPTLLTGQPVKVTGVITYNFVLQ